MCETRTGRTIPGVTHHRIAVNGTNLHYVSAGESGAPILLVHGFPETWWAFHKVIPLLATHHRVFAVDLRGFGDSDTAPEGFDSTIAAEDLHGLVQALGLGPLHLTAQDISGAAAFRFAATYPSDILSFTAIEMGLAGFGLEEFANVANGGAWHIGVMASSGIPEMLLAGHEREFLGNFMFPAMCATAGAIRNEDIEEFTRTYSRPGGWRGATGLYASMLKEGGQIVEMAHAGKLVAPILAIDAGGGGFTADTMAQAVPDREIRSILLEGVGHYAVMEAPEKVAGALLDFVGNVGTH
ncbi:MAG: alpha/beta hydrolase [Sphingobium sp.]